MPPVNLLIKPASSLCNMRCKYCFYADVSRNRDTLSYGRMEEETLETLVKRAFEYATGYAGFAFQGGEPTLAGLNFYRKLIELQNKYNTRNLPVYNSIQTNGYALNEEWAAFFSEHHFLVGLSLDGTKEAHNALRLDAKGEGTYDTVVRSAALLEQAGVDFNILCVVNNYVARHPQKVYNNLKKYRYLQFIPCLDDFDGEKESFSLTPQRYGMFLKTTFDLYYQDFMAGNYVSIRNFDNYIRMLQGYPPESCAMNGVCTCYFVIEGDGSVFPCDFYVLDQWKLGNIREDSFEAMEEARRASGFVAWSARLPEECKACRWLMLCRNGCRRNREPVTADGTGKNYFCSAYQNFLEYAYPRLQQLASAILRHAGKHTTKS